MDEVYRNGKVSLIIINDSVQKWDWREFYFVQIWQISCYATTKRNKVPQNPYSSDLFVMVTLYSYRKKNVRLTMHMENYAPIQNQTKLSFSHISFVNKIFMGRIAHRA